MEPLRTQRFESLLEDIASSRPAPGGGSVGAAAGALAAALAHMVVAFSTGKPSLAEHHDELARIADRLRSARRRLLELGDEDAAAYTRLSRTLGLQKDDPKRSEQLPGAVMTAARVPLAVLRECEEMAGFAERLLEIGNKNLRSDLAGAAILGEAAARCAGHMVRINLPSLADESRRAEMANEAEKLETGCIERFRKVDAACR